MQSKDTRFPIKVGRVSIELDKGVYLRLRFSVDSTRYVFPFGKFTNDRLTVAKATARSIDSDITFRCFDPTLEKYGKQPELPIPINNSVITQPKEITLLEIWEQYKALKFHTIAPSTRSSDWRRMDRIFDKTEKLDATIVSCEILITEQLEFYAVGTLRQPFKSLQAAINIALDKEQVSKNPLTKLIPLMLPSVKQDIRAFTALDISEILNAFESDRYLDVHSQYKHSHYWYYVKFRTLCGCRPSEAIALTWDDIKQKKER